MMKTGSIRAGAIHGKEKKANEINAKTSVSLVNGLSECKKLFAGTKKERSRFMCKSYLKLKKCRKRKYLLLHIVFIRL
jgi:hypothetical protein